MDLEYTLKFENQTAVVSSFGASLRSYVVSTAKGDWSVLWGYSGTANKKGGQGDVLIPFPGRIKAGEYEFAGQKHELIKNDKDGPNAIHGFVRAESFKTDSVDETHAAFSFSIDADTYAGRGYPFSLLITVRYELGASGLKTSFAIKNTGNTSAPVGAGFHPYFRADVGTLETWEAQIPAKNYVELKDNVPTGKILAVEGTRYDFRNSRQIKDEKYNGCLAHLERDSKGFAIATLKANGSSNEVVITMDEAFDYVVIYTGDAIPAPNQRQGFAIEPMTCAPDAFNYKGWGTKILESGAEFSGTYSVHARVLET